MTRAGGSATSSARITWRCFRYVLSKRPSFVVLSAAAGCVRSLAVVATVWLTKHAFDEVTRVVATGAPVGAALPSVTLLGLSSGLAMLTSLASEQLLTREAEHLGFIVDSEIIRSHNQVLILNRIESESYQSSLHLALQNSCGAMLGLVNDAFTLVTSLASLLALGGVMSRVSVAAVACAAIGSLHVAYVQHRIGLHRWSFAQEEGRRARLGLQLRDALVSLRRAALVRALPAAGGLRRRWEAEQSQLLSRRAAMAASERRWRLLGVVVSALTTGVAYCLVATRVVVGGGSVGDLGMGFAGVSQIGGVVSSLFSKGVGIRERIGNVRVFFDVVDRGSEPEPARKPRDAAPALACEGVTFRYRSGTPVMEGLSVQFPGAELSVIRGANGSGKSTLLKLLAGLYVPQEGRVLVDGEDLRSLAPSAYRTLCSTSLQESEAFPLTLRENLACGLTTEPALALVSDALEAARATRIVMRLPAGLETQLDSSVSSGRDLSRGEWQRCVVARMLLQDRRIVLMDEPTAAVDPEAELQMVSEFKRRLAGRTVVIATHSEVVTQIADAVFVMESGSIRRLR